tara:strand:- start:15 stop:1190 length:1176 start_codon:yes stop_codon:yes gene_type:complete
MNEDFEKEVESVSSELETGNDQVQAEELSGEMQDQVRQLESLAKMDPEFANSDEYKDLMASVNEEAPKAEREEEEQEEEEQEEEEQEEEDDDVFGVSKTNKKSKKIDINFDVPDEMIDMISSKFGIEDPSKFFASADTWRTQAQEGAEASKEYEALSSDLQSMPLEIKQAVQLWANGDNYLEAFNKNERLDFSGSFKDQETENLVQHYLEDEYNDLVDKYNDEKFDDEDFEDRIQLLARTTKRMFNSDKDALEKEREDFVKQQRDDNESLRKSALLSVENLGKAYPNFSKSEISKIRNLLVDGKVENLFTGSDGAYKDDAAELLAYAMYGKKMMSSAQKRAEKQGESKANLKAVDSSPKKMRRQKSSDQERGKNLDAVSHLSSAFKKDPYA